MAIPKKYPAWIKTKTHRLMYNELSTSGRREWSMAMRKWKLKQLAKLKRELKK